MEAKLTPDSLADLWSVADELMVEDDAAGHTPGANAPVLEADWNPELERYYEISDLARKILLASIEGEGLPLDGEEVASGVLACFWAAAVFTDMSKTIREVYKLKGIPKMQDFDAFVAMVKRDVDAHPGEEQA